MLTDPMSLGKSLQIERTFSVLLLLIMAQINELHYHGTALD